MMNPRDAAEFQDCHTTKWRGTTVGHKYGVRTSKQFGQPKG